MLIDVTQGHAVQRETVHLTIDGLAITANTDDTVFITAKKAGVTIPSLCASSPGSIRIVSPVSL